ncbi:hypothetical protein Tdes44962_MAKER05310, partial [Teratosphaeria destructans]
REPAEGPPNRLLRHHYYRQLALFTIHNTRGNHCIHILRPTTSATSTMHLKQILLALTATSGLALAAPQMAPDANAPTAPEKRADKPAPAPKPIGKPVDQPASSWLLTGYSTGECTADKFDTKSAPAYSNNLVQGCKRFDADNTPTSVTFDGKGAWQLYLFEDEKCKTSDAAYQGDGFISANDLRCYDVRGMPYQEPNAGRLTSTAYLDSREATGCSVQVHRHMLVGTTKPHATQSVPVRITTATPSAATRSWKAKLLRTSESPQETRYRSAIEFALQMTDKTHKTLVRPSATFAEFEQEMRVRYLHAIEAFFDRCQIPVKCIWSFVFVGRPPRPGHAILVPERARERLPVDESCWDMIKLLASEWEEVRLELCFRLEDADDGPRAIDELPPPYESLDFT